MPDEEREQYAREQIAKIKPVINKVLEEDYAGGVDVPDLKGGFEEAKDIIQAVVDKLEEKNAKLLSLYERDYANLKGWVESMTSGVLMFDSKKQVLLVNSMLRQIMGLRDEELSLENVVALMEQKETGLKEEGFLYAEVREGVWNRMGFGEAIDLMMEKGYTIKYLKVPLKEKFFEVHINPVRDEKGQVSGGAMVLHDITMMVEIDKMKTDFVSVASHQLRTPLTAMRLYAEMLLNEDVGGLNSGQKDYVEKLQESTLRLIKLVNEFLNVSRLESGRLKIEPELTQFEDLIEKVIADLKPLIEERGCKVVFDKPKEPLLQIALDQGLMHEVVNNLLTNAVYYSPTQSGLVEVGLERKAGISPEKMGKKEEGEENEYIFGTSDYLLLSVRDNGIGIPKEVQSRIFGKFYRADNAMRERSDGSGLGLYLVKLIVEASGCKTWFKSPAFTKIEDGKETGWGTMFYVGIPIQGMLPKEGEKTLAA